MKGTVKFFNDVKRFGFVKGEDDKEYFIHQTGLKEGTRIREDDVVKFDTEEGDKGLKAVNVERIDEEASESEASEEAPEEESEVQEEEPEEKEE